MYIVITKYGRSALRLNYRDEELKKVVEDFVDKANTKFSFSELCDYLLERAAIEDRFQREPYTRYTDIVLTEQDEHRLSVILWQKIWNQELVIEFRSGNMRQSNDVMFGVVKQRY